MGGNNIEISGPAMAVLAGIVLIISPWMIPLAFLYKLLIAIFGLILCWSGVSN